MQFRRPKTLKRLPDFLSEEEVDRLLRAADPFEADGSHDDGHHLTGHDAKAVRARAIVDALFSSGLRVSELVSLNTDDIAWENAELRVTGKGDTNGSHLSATARCLPCVKPLPCGPMRDNEPSFKTAGADG